jgi:signal transduction histidine kinase
MNKIHFPLPHISSLIGPLRDDALTGRSNREIAILRRRIARQIDDIVAPDFSKILTQLRAVIPSAANTAGLAHLHLAIAAAEEGLVQAKSLVRLLGAPIRVPDKSAQRIGEALKAELDRILVRTSIALVFRSETGISLARPMTHEILQISREVVMNAVKHSAARSVRCSVRTDGNTLLLNISDDGAGFEPDSCKKGFGLLGLKERAQSIGAQVQVESSAGRGTTITLRCPLACNDLKRKAGSWVHLLSRKENICLPIGPSQF